MIQEYHHRVAERKKELEGLCAEGIDEIHERMLRRRRLIDAKYNLESKIINTKV